MSTILTQSQIRQAITTLESAGVLPNPNGSYNLYVEGSGWREIFREPETAYEIARRYAATLSENSDGRKEI